VGAAGGGNDLSGAAWLSARCGRWWLKCVTYWVSTAMRWWRLMISIRSSSSRRAVAIHRSAVAFAGGACIGVRRMRMASLLNAASKTLVNLLSRGPDQHRELRRAVAEVHHEVACVLGHPGTAGVGGGSEEVDASGRVVDDEQCVQPLEQ
jgi:hypothetical protein